MCVVQQGNGWMFMGEKVVVVYGVQVDKLIVLVCMGGEVCDMLGLLFFVVDCNVVGVMVKDYCMIDNLCVVDICFDNVLVMLLGIVGEVWEIIDVVVDFGCVLLCVEVIGLIDVLNVVMLEYIKICQQFGVFIVCFQVLQYCMVDMFIYVEQVCLIIYLVVVYFEDGDVEVCCCYVLVVKVCVGQVVCDVGQEVV